jgi:nucleoside-diphosphate-sugar epimerase
MRGLQTKTIMVTGGGGIGSATCRRFAAARAKVAVLDRNLDAAKVTAAVIAAAGGTGVAIACGITRREDADKAVADVIDRFSAIDVLINDAGWDIFKPFTQTQPIHWERLISVNPIGALHMHHAVLPGMIARKAGRIVTIASDAARGGSSGEAVDAACNGGPGRVLQDHRPGASPARLHGQRGLPWPNRDGAVRRRQGRRWRPGETRRGIPPRHPARPHRPARGSATTRPTSRAKC